MEEKLEEQYMRLAVAEARKNLETMEGGPFGACLVRDDQVLAVARNTVHKNDASCHAEINAIRIASKKLKTFDLSGCHIYSTTEPCPMCFSAIHWARIEVIVYGTTVADARRVGFNELHISNSQMKKLGGSKVELVSGFLREECSQLFQEWDRLENKAVY